MADRAMKGIFITTSNFTTQAREFAAQSGIELVNLVKCVSYLKSTAWPSMRSLAMSRLSGSRHLRLSRAGFCKRRSPISRHPRWWPYDEPATCLRIAPKVDADDPVARTARNNLPKFAGHSSPPARNWAHKRHTGLPRDQVLWEFQWGVIDRGISTSTLNNNLPILSLPHDSSAKVMGCKG
jgi:hypothetical protein